MPPAVRNLFTWIIPREIWEETNRLEAFGEILFHIKNLDYVLAHTHEEIITYYA